MSETIAGPCGGDEREALRWRVEVILARSIGTARKTEVAGAWSDHDRLTALGALDHLDPNILSGLVADELFAAGWRRSTVTAPSEPTDDALIALSALVTVTAEQVERWRQDSVRLNRVCWRVHELLGEIPPGATRIIVDEDVEPLLDRLATVLAAHLAAGSVPADWPRLDEAGSPRARADLNGPENDSGVIPAWLNPDCTTGKHRACAGDAWDDDHDQPTTCGCDCHREGA